MIKNQLQILSCLILTSLLVLHSCKSKQIISSDADVIVFDNTTNTQTDSNENLPNENNTEIPVLDNPTKLDTVEVVSVKKKRYNVAIVLPFMEDSVRKNWSIAAKDNFKNFETPEASEISISFYEGFVMALKELDLVAKFDIKVYDTQLQSTTTEQIAKKLKDDETDIIIGPYLTKNISIICEMAKNNNMIVISPFSPSSKVVSNYEKYYMIEPSFQRHQEAIINYGLNDIVNPHFKYIYQGNSFGKKNAIHFSSYLDSFNLGKDFSEQVFYSILEQDKDEVKDFKLTENMDSEKTNMLIINSFDESFLSVFLQKLSKFKEDKNLISFGMPGWEDSQILRMSHLSNNKIHFTTSSWIFDNDKTTEIKEIYHEKHKKTPSDEVYLAYDIAQIFLPLIDNEGLDFNSKLLNNNYEGLNRNYLFNRFFDNENNLRIENAALHIYKIEEFERILVK